MVNNDGGTEKGVFLELDIAHIYTHTKFANRPIPDFFLPVARVSEANISGFGMPKS